MYSAIEKYDDRDYIEEFTWSSEWELFWKNFSNYKYNQKFVDPYSCTGQAADGCISDVINWPLPLSFRKDTWARQLKTWAIEWFWDTIQNWVKQSVKQFNEEYPELPFRLEYYRIKNIKNIHQLAYILNNFSSVITWYKGSLYSDAQDNGIIDNIDNPDGNGHCIRIVKIWEENKIPMIKYCDNYEGVNIYNIITVKDFLNNKDFFTGWYYIKKVNK